MQTKKPSAISLFAGGGGLSLGIGQAGFETIFATDVETSSRETFAHNMPKVPFWQGDIRRLTQDLLKGFLNGKTVDLVVGVRLAKDFLLSEIRIQVTREIAFFGASSEWWSGLRLHAF